jgi:hypothetical protein
MLYMFVYVRVDETYTDDTYLSQTYAKNAFAHRTASHCSYTSPTANCLLVVTGGPVFCTEMTVNKMLHDGLVRDTQLNQAPSKRCTP